MGKECRDHLGNVYSSITDMCKIYNIPHATYLHRIQNGWTLEDALTKAKTKPHFTKKQYKQVTDFAGNIHNSVHDMCNYYGITLKAYYHRLNRGYSQEQALTMPLMSNKGQIIKDPTTGIIYSSILKMLSAHNITKSAYDQRRAKGLSIEQALNYKPKERHPFYTKRYNIQGPDGIIYRTARDMCDKYKMNYSTYTKRIYNGWSVEDALTIPRNMYIGEYRVAECLKRLNIKFYHDCTIKTIFKDLNIFIEWDDFLNELQQHLNTAGINWSKKKIEKLRPDFVLYTDKDNKIHGVIEFDGEQHQNFVEYFFKTIEEFLYRSNSDFVKQSLWEYLNIPMLRIRHDQVDMIEEMVTDFVNQPEKYINNHNTYLSEEEYWSILTEQKAKIESAFAA